MKHLKTPENSALAHSLRDVSSQNRNRRNLWFVVAGLALATSGVVYAQTNASSLPAPPAMPAPPAGAPMPPVGGPMPGAPKAGDLKAGKPAAPKAGAPMPGMPMPGALVPPAPGMEGRAPMPPDANTLNGAARSLERAYRAAGEVTDANDLSAAARTFYTRALSAYGDKNYAQSFKLAEGSARLSRTARGLSNAGNTQLPEVPGLTPPPLIATTNDSDRAARELNRNYDEANRAAKFDNAISNRYGAQSEENYRAALAAYNNKNYEEAAQRARMGAEQARAAREYAEISAF